MWVIHWGLLWGCPGGLGFAPVRTRLGGGVAAWVAVVLAATCTQGNWWLEKQEIWCSWREWQSALANMLQYSWLEKPLSDRAAWQATAHRVTWSRTQLKRPGKHKHKTFFFFFLPVAARPQWELSVKVVQLLGLQGPWWRLVFRDTNCLRGRSYDPFPASCSWWSEGLFGQSFSVALPV